MTKVIRGRLAAHSLTALVAVAVLAFASPAAMAQPSRSDVANAVQDAMIYARTMPDAFGGVWVTDDGAVFAFTARATDEQVADVLGRVTAGIPVSTVRVDWAEAELDATTDAITDAMGADELSFVTGVGPDLPNNAVRVSIAPEFYDVCQAGLIARFGPVRLLFESSPGDTGAQPSPAGSSAPSPSGSPAPLPPGCLPPPSPFPSAGASWLAPTAFPAPSQPTTSPLPAG
jgi:hypothetical protein